MPFLKYKRLKLKLRVFLAGHSVAMVTYNVTKTIPTCSPMIGQFFDTDPSKSTSWKELETVLSHLNLVNFAPGRLSSNMIRGPTRSENEKHLCM